MMENSVLYLMIFPYCFMWAPENHANKLLQIIILPAKAQFLTNNNNYYHCKMKWDKDTPQVIL